MVPRRLFPIALLLAAALLSLGGCGGAVGSSGGGGYTPPPGGFPGLAFSGTVVAGSSPVQGAAVQLYAAGTDGNGSAATQLLPTALQTDAAGHFTVSAGLYACPLGTSILYVVARGGSVGSGETNSASALMSAPGACEGVSAGSSFVVNELTTAASVYALRPFLAPGAQLGASSTNAAGLGLALGTLGKLVNLTSGTAAGASFPTNGTFPTAKLNTIARVLHGCIVSAGPDSSPCASLFAATTAGSQPSDTLDAALNLARHPGTNVGAIYNLSTTVSAFSPALTAAPPDWTLAIPFTGGGMNAPGSVAIDSAGNIWVANYFAVASLFRNTGEPVFGNGVSGYGLNESYGAAVDPNDVAWIANEENTDYTLNGGFGSVTLLNSAGPALTGASQYAAGGLSFPVAVAIDETGAAWIVDYGDGHLTLLSNTGVPQSGNAGYTTDQFAFPVAVAVDSRRNGWVANQSSSTVTRVAPDGSSFTSYTVGAGPSGVAVDAADNVWTANYYADSVGLVSAAGTVLSGAGFTGGGLAHPSGIATDGDGTVWVANYRGAGISAMAGASAAAPGAALSPATGWAPDLALLEAYGVAIDAAGSVWVSSFGDNRLVEFVGIATPVKTPLLGRTRVP